MGNSLQNAKSALEQPLTESALRSHCAHYELGELSATITHLLDGRIPTNFSYDDILSCLAKFTSKNFVIVPVWTLNLKRIHTSAMCLVKHWPEWTPEEIEDPDFLSNVRVMVIIIMTISSLKFIIVFTGASLHTRATHWACSFYVPGWLATGVT